ncbi:hypothetical protein D5S18_03060 [Nocardia panacis]|uniref:Uncharacterized protein n=1 Tax=Nocardia panacis TaxID=2340916 RepID=A0A3A4KT52_9NOCA|nr:hypothetical protein D5S18_03060 [Nocardia panacis]
MAEVLALYSRSGDAASLADVRRAVTAAMVGGVSYEEIAADAGLGDPLELLAFIDESSAPAILARIAVLREERAKALDRDIRIKELMAREAPKARSRTGLSEVQLAKNFGVQRTVLRNWLGKPVVW